ncbi:MAG: hypothetical protein GX201_08315 [Clostridiales bacterium]|nr:hypothetical protein [Clostridiales bacterium]
MKKMMICPLIQNRNWGMPHNMHTHMYPPYTYMDDDMGQFIGNIFLEDDRDDEYFDRMYPDSCKKIMPYIDKELDKMETEESPLYEGYPGKEMLERIGDRIYDKIVSDMPEMEEQWEGRQYGRRRFLRDFVGVLLLANLGRRRRRRRRRYYDSYDNYWYNY